MLKILIATPCMAMLHKDFVESLFSMTLNSMMMENLMAQVMFAEGSLTYDARNIITKKAIAGGFDRVLWIDSDMVFEPDTLKRLSSRMDEGLEYVSTLAFRRKPPYKPVIYSQIGTVKDQDGRDKTIMIPYEPYPENQLFEIAGSGFGCVMTSVQLLKDCNDKFGLPFSPRLGFGEDVTFCIECHELGRKMYCDSSIKVGHIGSLIVDEGVYNAKVLDNHPGTQ